MGKWIVLGDGAARATYAETLAVHAALLHTGQILYFSGDAFDRSFQHAWATRKDFSAIDHTRLFDCVTFAVRTIGSPRADLFCSGHAFLGDGRLLVAGGTEMFRIEDGSRDAPHHHLHWPGLRSAFVFDPEKTSWSAIADMGPGPKLDASDPDPGGGRWYPTLLTLANGDVLAVAGHPSHNDVRHNNNTPERYSPDTDVWSPLLPLGEPSGRRAGVDPTGYFLVYYPRLFLLPSGHVFSADPLYTAPDPRANESIVFEPEQGRIIATHPGPSTVTALRGAYTNEGNTGAHRTAVLLPLLPENGYRPRVLLAGGPEAAIIDLGSEEPRWAPTSPRTLPGAPERIHPNAVLLPTGEALILGGVQPGHGDDEHAAVREAELYDPEKGTWTHDPEKAEVPRQYHSVALLMPDGRIFTAGSDKEGNTGIAAAELRVEIYEPWYVAEPRPAITGAPEAVKYGEPIVITAPSAAEVARVAVIRAGSCTHSFNADQRYVGLVSTATAPDTIEATAPPNGNVAPPGHYLLFVIDRRGVPSVGRFLFIGA
ncbi:galactose oxidase-like protein [Minicystis rosea]|nr:galactose oxidase-like protein [Minicystis rosea]